MTASQQESRAEIPILRDLTPEELGVFDTFQSELWLESGDTLFAEGEKSLLRLLPGEDFEAIVQEHPVIATKILRYIARSLSLNLRQISNVLSDSMHL